jgi:hypothetical protein
MSDCAGRELGSRVRILPVLVGKRGAYEKSMAFAKIV